MVCEDEAGELVAAEGPEAGAVAPVLALFFLDFDDVVPDDAVVDVAVEDAVELPDAVVDFLDFVVFLLLVDVEVWSLVEPVCDCAHTAVADNARNRHNDTPQGNRAMFLFKGISSTASFIRRASGAERSPPHEVLSDLTKRTTAYNPSHGAT